MTRLSQHFTLEELIVSSAADQMGIPNTPLPEHLENMERFLVPGLEWARAVCGDRPMVLTSAYRNPQVNDRVGGTPTSAHPKGYAADLRIAGLSSLATARILAPHIRAKAWPVDQMIWESGRSIVHLSFDPQARRQCGHQPGGPGTPINWRYFN